MDSNYQIREEAKELVKKEDGIRGIVVGNDVYDALTFSPEIIRFSAKQYRFLHAYRLGISIQDACTKSGLTLEQADRFLKKPDTVSWLQDRALKDHIKNEWSEPGKWYAEMDRLYNTEDVPKHKIDILREFGDRVCPKVSRNADNAGKTIIEINIDPAAIERSRSRREAKEADIVQEKAS